MRWIIIPITNENEPDKTRDDWRLGREGSPPTLPLGSGVHGWEESEV